MSSQIAFSVVPSLREQLNQVKERDTQSRGSAPEDRGGRVSSFPRPLEAVPWTLPIERFSASSLSLFQECPRAWQNRYLLKKEEPANERQILGSAFHAAMAFNWNAKYLTEKDLPVTSVVEFFHDQAWPLAKQDTKKIIWNKGEEDQKNMGARLLESYIPKVPHIDPEFTELPIILELEEIPVPIKGYVDCVQKGNLPIIDLKTAARAITAPKPRWKIQGWVYQLALEKPLEWHIVTKTKTPELIVLPESKPTEYARLHLTYLAHLANWLYNVHGLENPWPATGIGHDWVCKSCFYRTDCPAWAKGGK